MAMTRESVERAGIVSALLLLVSLGAVACGAKKEPEPSPPEQRIVSGQSRQTAYIGGIAAAFYCTCDHWPGSWAELGRFDDYLHASASEHGDAPIERFEWSQYEDVPVAPDREGNLLIRLGATGLRDVYDIAVPYPDCSRFDPRNFAGGCEAAASTR